MHKECADEAIHKLNDKFGYRQFLRIINGAIKNTIDIHGDIKKENYGSASKRISKQLWNQHKRIINGAIIDDK